MRQNKLLQKIPISVLVATKNEEACLGRCLDALAGFAEVVVIDSGSTDRTQEIARERGARVVDFTWNGQYPKKRQWCLDNLSLAHDWVFFVDADEVVTPEAIAGISALDYSAAGYFVRSAYVWDGHVLRHGLKNNKLVLFDRRRVEFPVVDDLDISGMGEMEGHYQPVLRAEFAGDCIGQLRAEMLHYAADDMDAWEARHVRYARWEAAMDQRAAWPEEADTYRRILKVFFKNAPFRSFVAFVHSYLLKLGFLDGVHGFNFALSRWRYYRMISAILSQSK